jgi:hypothetical protein
MNRIEGLELDELYESGFHKVVLFAFTLILFAFWFDLNGVLLDYDYRNGKI